MAGRKRPIRKLYAQDQNQEDLEGLLVFGYECKLFRDDEKAVYVNDENRSLIPWMGDSSLLIDRYDGRGHLYDLHEHDAANIRGGQELDEKEKKIEALCDEERYLELHTDMAEKRMYEEEEIKRLNQAYSECQDGAGNYGAVGFSYGQAEQAEEEDNANSEVKEEEEEEPFIVTPELQLPQGMLPPVTEKAFTIIQKTAKFVSQQGTQMEIIIKIKQANNPQFAFLEHEDPLNPFYKHLISLMKSGKYKPPTKEKPKTSPEGKEYLHPKLARLMKQEPEPELNRKDFLESVSSKLPSGQLTNSVYAKLVNNMKSSGSGRNSPVVQRPVHSQPTIPKIPVAAPAPVPSVTYTEEMPMPAVPYPVTPTSAYPAPAEEYGPVQMPIPPPPGMEPVTLPAPSLPQNQPPPPGTVPPETEMPSYNVKLEPSYDVQQQSMSAVTAHSGYTDAGYDNTGYAEAEYTDSTGYAEAAYTDGYNHTESSHQIQPEYVKVEPPENMTLPAPEMQQIIDKMAAYVAKNGPDFEHIVKNKNDERFHFLQSWHVYNKFYEYRKNVYLNEMGVTNFHSDEKYQKLQLDEKLLMKAKSPPATNVQPGKGVSFSIKAKENEGAPLTSRKLMLYDSSDEEDGQENVKKEVESTPDEQNGLASTSQDKQIKSEKPAVDPEEIERRQAEERLKDKISNAAREKVAAATREKQIQAERKRRAAMFINMLKESEPSGKSSKNKDETQRESGQTSLAGSTCSTSPVNSRASSPVILIPSRDNSVAKSPPPGKSPSRGSSERDVEKKKSRDRDRERRHRREDWSPRRSRSPAWSSSRWRRSPSPRRRHRSKTPPTSYAVTNRKSPSKRSRSRSPTRHKKKSRKSRSRSKDKFIPRARSRSPTRKSKKSKKSSRSKSRSVSPPKKSKSRSGSVSRKSRSRSPSSKKSKKSKSKHKSKSPSRSKSSKDSYRDKLPLPLIEEARAAAAERPPLPTSEPRFSPRPPLPLSTPPNGPDDDDVIIISPEKEERASPLRTPPPEASSSSTTQANTQVSQDLLLRVREMLKATRRQILKEDGMMPD